MRVCSLILFAAWAGAADVTMSVSGTAFHMYASGSPAQLKVSIAHAAPGTLPVLLTAKDAWGRPTTWTHTDDVQIAADGSGTTIVAAPTDVGFYRVTAALQADHASLDLGVVPAPAVGLRPRSFYCSNTSHLRSGEELAFLATLGFKVQRVHFQGRDSVVPATPNGALPIDFAPQDADLAASRAAGVDILPIVGYALAGAISVKGQQAGMYGPPRDYAEFLATWEVILKQHQEFQVIEFWNEPWIFGWTWADTPAAYRDLQKKFCEMAKRVNPKLEVVAGNSSMFVEDHIEHDPASWKGLLSGTTHHPYSGCGTASFGTLQQARSIDHGAQINRRMGLSKYLITEGATLWASPDKAIGNNALENARKSVQFLVCSALAGAWQSNIQWDLGYGPAWTLPNTAVATLTSLTEDRVCVAEVWPSHELLWGAVYAHPRHVNAAVRGLPRASEISTRWSEVMPEGKKADSTKVAVLWNFAGKAGTCLALDQPGDVRALDLTGRSIARQADGSLSVPFGEDQVYLLSDTLDVVAFNTLIQHARIEKLIPVSVFAQPLSKSVTVAQNVGVVLENHTTTSLTGSIFLSVIDASGADQSGSAATFSVEPGKVLVVPVPWVPQVISSSNGCAVRIHVKTTAGTVETPQILQVGRFIKGTPAIDGSKKGWEQVPAVVIDSDRLQPGTDITRYVLNPNLRRAEASAPRRAQVRLQSAWDEKCVYIRAEVEGDSFANSAGKPVMKGTLATPYLTADPAGLEHIRHTGDALFLAFGFRDRVPSKGRQMADPWVWKGHFHDTDVVLAAHTAVGGARLVQLWGSDGDRRNGYQTEKLPFQGDVPGGHSVVIRDEQTQITTYVVAIPRTTLPGFDPLAGACRFTFRVTESKPVRDGMTLDWGEAAGVFSHWQSMGTYSPTWDTGYPCQTIFTIAQ